MPLLFSIQLRNYALCCGMQGDVAQIIVPAELGYPLTGDPQHDIVGPK